MKRQRYIPSEENKKASSPIGTIFIIQFLLLLKCKIFSRKLQSRTKTDYEKLVFEIITDGSIHPQDALTEAAKVLIQHL